MHEVVVEIIICSYITFKTSVYFNKHIIMRKLALNIVALAIITMTVTSCGEDEKAKVDPNSQEQKAKVQKDPKEEPKDTVVEKKVTKTNELLIETTSFYGISIGDDISEHADKLKKALLQTGEGDFDIFEIRKGEDVLGFIFPNYKDETKVGDITVTSPLASTKEGLKVGSTFEELEKVFTDFVINGSEIEGYTHVEAAGLAYKLDVYMQEQNIDKSKIDKSTKITEINIQPRP